MKAINAIYKYRHLYNVETGERLIIDENAEVSITLLEPSLLKQDPYNPPHKKLRSREEIISGFEADKKFYMPFLDRGSKLWFRVNAGEKVIKRKASGTNPESSDHEDFVNNKDAFLFEIELNEDLFWISNTDDFKKSEVSPCACTVVRECYNHLRFFERIYAPSLNQAYTKTYEFYFPMYASANASIYNKISLSERNNDFIKFFRR